MMPSRNPRPSSLRQWLAVLLGLLTASLAWAQTDPPGRVARLNYLEGRASFLLEDGGTWSPAEFNRPLTNGNQVATEPGSRAEIHTGSTALRLDGSTWLTFTSLDDTTAQIQVVEGSLAVRIRTLFPGEHYEIDTANMAFVASQPGEYRIDVNRSDGTTRVALFSGSGVAYGENAEAQMLAAPQQITFTGRQLGVTQSTAEAPRDSFDLWVSARNIREDQATSARYVSRETLGYQQLDAWGAWGTDPFYGPIWWPNVTIVDWAPYRYGQWRWISPWGWTWVDDAPWGFAPFHYGRWVQIGLRWAWVPGPIAARPIYAPALVGFIGVSGLSGNVSWSLSIGTGGVGAGIGWFPLAPGEIWRPAYPASRHYLDRVNHWPSQRDERRPPNGYRYQHQRRALTVVPADDFGHRRPYRSGGYTSTQPHLPDRELSRTQAVPLPPRTVVREEGRLRMEPLAPSRPGAPAATQPRPEMRQAPGIRIAPTPVQPTQPPPTTRPQPAMPQPPTPRAAPRGPQPTPPAPTAVPQPERRQPPAIRIAPPPAQPTPPAPPGTPSPPEIRQPAPGRLAPPAAQAPQRTTPPPAVPTQPAPTTVPQPEMRQPPTIRMAPPAAPPAQPRMPEFRVPSREVVRPPLQQPQQQPPPFSRPPEQQRIEPAPPRREPAPISQPPAQRMEPPPVPQRQPRVEPQAQPRPPARLEQERQRPERIQRPGRERERPAGIGPGQDGEGRR